MQITRVQQNRPSFKGFMNNKLLLSGLEKVADHGATFTAGLSFVLPLTIRPLAISLTPNVEQENKQYACANSICSGLTKFGLMAAVALPIEYAVKKIDRSPEKFLKPFTIDNLKGGEDKLIKAKSYKLMSQVIKLGTGFLTAIPKSVLTIALIPLMMDKLFDFSNKTKKEESKSGMPKQVSFSGALHDRLAKTVGKIMDNESFQEFAKRHVGQEKNVAKHMMASTDVLLTGTFAYQTSNSEGIKENRKKALIYNNLISTAITIVGGYGIDRLIKDKTSSFVDYFSAVNRGNPKLHKYIEGINIVRPAIIFATVYYAILPMFSTYFAERIDKFVNKKA